MSHPGGCDTLSTPDRDSTTSDRDATTISGQSGGGDVPLVRIIDGTLVDDRDGSACETLTAGRAGGLPNGFLRSIRER